MHRSYQNIALIVACLLFSLVSSGNLYGIWDSPNYTVEIYSANETTGYQISQLFQNQSLATLFGYPVTATSSKDLVFVPLIGDYATLNSTIVGFDFSDPNSIKQQWEFLVPLTASIVQYVPSLNRLYVGGYYEPMQENATTSNFTMGYVDLKNNVYHQLVVFSRQVGFPSFGSCFAFVPSKNLFVLGMLGNQQVNEPFLVTVDAITGKVTLIPQPSFYAQAMLYDPTSQTVYAILTSAQFNFSNSNLYWGTVDLSSGTYVPISQWNQQTGEFVFVIEGIITADFEKKVAYSIIGDGEGPPVAYVSIDMKTGDFLGAHYYQNQPQFIFYLSD